MGDDRIVVGPQGDLRFPSGGACASDAVSFAAARWSGLLWEVYHKKPDGSVRLIEARPLRFDKAHDAFACEKKPWERGRPVMKPSFETSFDPKWRVQVHDPYRGRYVYRPFRPDKVLVKHRTKPAKTWPKWAAKAIENQVRSADVRMPPLGVWTVQRSKDCGYNITVVRVPVSIRANGSWLGSKTDASPALKCFILVIYLCANRVADATHPLPAMPLEMWWHAITFLERKYIAA